MPRTFNLADLFEIVVEAVPERLAFACGAERLSFRTLDIRSNQLGNALRARGVKRGDNVGIQLYNSAAYLETFLACCKIGAVPVNVNYRYVADELVQLFNSLDLRVLVYGAEFTATVAETVPRVQTLALSLCVSKPGLAAGPGEDYEQALSGGAATLSDPERSDNDIYMLCTGGTTGLPKGVMWPHKALFMAALGGGGYYFRRPPIEHPEVLAELVPNAPPLAYLATAPMMHGASMWATLISLLSGHPVIVNDQNHFDAEHIWDIVERDGVNVIAIVGDAMALPLVQALERHPGRWNLSRLMIFGNGGAVFSRHLQERLKGLLPHLMLNNGMASSESGVIGGGEKPVEGDGFMRVTPRPDICVIDTSEGGLRVVSAPGEQGTLARSGYTPVGYYGDAKKSAETFVRMDGRIWVLTGDSARIDASGDIVVLGRGSQCINSGGEKVFPEEVEEAARRYAAVRDVLVVGIADERWGQKVVAVVEVEPGQRFDEAEFEQVCRIHLSGYKLPRAVFIADQVRRSPAGKADYRWAKAYAAEQAGAS